jgi:hypothetical protein
MTRNLTAADWKMLRVIARGPNPVTGRNIRAVDFTRKTKDGTFLKRLAEVGLIACATQHRDPFESAYVLTDLGAHAAEYGEYDDSLTPWGMLTPAQVAAEVAE